MNTLLRKEANASLIRLFIEFSSKIHQIIRHTKLSYFYKIRSIESEKYVLGKIHHQFFHKKRCLTTNARVLACVCTCVEADHTEASVPISARDEELVVGGDGETRRLHLDALVQHVTDLSPRFVTSCYTGWR